MNVAAGAERHTLSVLQASTMLVGMVLGVFIFTAPTLAALNTATPAQFLGLWLAGGVATLIGALCYAELATTYPDEGGEYNYLRRAYGEGVGFLFAWGRMTVIQTGAIAAVGFGFGEYAQKIYSIGGVGTAIYGALAIAALTAVQLKGTQETANTQTVLTSLEVLGLLLIAAIGFMVAKGQPAGAAEAGSANIGLAMVFILLAYGGWNELSYISNDMKDVRRNMAPVLVLGVIAVTVLYLLVNWAYMSVLGIGGLRKTFTPAADLVGQAFGKAGATVTALIVCAMALSTINASIFTGGRTTYALGRSFRPFGGLGTRSGNGVPINAVLLQGAICLALMALGSTTKSGFEYMVAYTAPVFWLFMIGVGLAVFILRAKDPGRERPFRVPLYPIVPLVWVGVTVFMFWSSLNYIFGQLWAKMTWGDTGVGAALGLVILALGVPVYLMGRSKAA
jgi:amino acid transporter